MHLFSRTNPRASKRGRGRNTGDSAAAARKERDASAPRPRQGTGGAAGSSGDPLSLSLPPSAKRSTSGGSDSCCSSSTASARTASTAAASTVDTWDKRRQQQQQQQQRGDANANNTASHNALALDIHSEGRKGHRASQRGSNAIGGAARADGWLQKHDVDVDAPPPALSPSSHSSSDSSLSSRQRPHRPPPRGSSLRSDPISTIEGEVAKLSSLLKKHRKYTPEWFALDSKLNAAREELDAVREDLDLLDFGPAEGEPGAALGGRARDPGAGAGIPETVLVRSDEGEGPVAEPDEAPGRVPDGAAAAASETRREYERAVRRLDGVERFSDEWFELQGRVIDLRTRGTEGPPLRSAENRLEPAPPAADGEGDAPLSYLNASLFPSDRGDGLFPLPYRDASSLFVPPRRSASPPPLPRCSPPSSPLVSRNLFPSSASINSSYYNNDDDDEREREQLIRLRGEYSNCCLELENLHKFSKEWFELKTRIVGMEEQLDNMESALEVERSVCESHLSGFSRSAAWSEEDDEIVSFASDLELVMIGEALKEGNCFPPVEDYEYFDEEALPLEACDWPETEEEREGRAAAALQGAWRRRRRQTSYRAGIWSVVRLQAFARRRLQMRKYDRQRRRLIVLQSSFRKRREASKYRLALSSASLIQTAWRRARVERSNALVAVTSIQSPVRRWLARSTYVHKRENAILVQSAWRGWSERRKFVRLRMGLVCLQSLSRRMCQRRRYGRILAGVLSIQRVTRGWLVRRQLCQEEPSVSQLAQEGQDPVQTEAPVTGECCNRNTSNNPSKPTTPRPSVEVIRSHHRALSLRRSQVPKFSDEWFYTTELLQGLEHELLLREREELDSSEAQSLEGTYDSRHDDERSGGGSTKLQLGSSERDDASSPGHVLRMVQSMEAHTSSRQLSPGQSSPGVSPSRSLSYHSSPGASVSRQSCTAAPHSTPGSASFSSNNFSLPQSPPNEEEVTLKRLGLECVRLSRELEELPRFSHEWFQSKVELKAVTEELEFLYSHLETSEARRSSC